jgi:hypothetical protein
MNRRREYVQGIFLTYCESDIILQELARTFEEIDPYEYKQILAARNFTESFWEPP